MRKLHDSDRRPSKLDDTYSQAALAAWHVNLVRTRVTITEQECLILRRLGRAI